MRRAGSRCATIPTCCALLEVLRVPRGSDRVVAGVASGWADRWRVEPTVVRAAVGLLTLAGGLGAVLYGLAAVTSTERREWSRHATAPRRGRPLAARAVHRLRDRRRARRLPGHRPVAGRRDHAPGRGDRRRDLRGVVDGHQHARPSPGGPRVPCRSSPARCWSSPASPRWPAAPAGSATSARRRAPSPSSSAGWPSSARPHSGACCAGSTTSGRRASARTSGRSSPPTSTTPCCSRWS